MIEMTVLMIEVENVMHRGRLFSTFVHYKDVDRAWLMLL